MLVCLVDSTQLLNSLQMTYLAEGQHNCPQTNIFPTSTSMEATSPLKQFCENGCYRPHLLFA